MRFIKGISKKGIVLIFWRLVELLVEYTIETDTTLKRNEDAILFLTEYEGPILENTKKYVVSGVYEGKFRLKEDNSIIPSELNNGELSKIELVEDLNLEEISNQFLATYP